MSLYDDLPAPTTQEESEPTVTNTKPENGWTPRFLQPIIRRPQTNKAKPNRSTSNTIPTSIPSKNPSDTKPPPFKPLTVSSKQAHPSSTSTSTETTPSSHWSQPEFSQRKPVRKKGGSSWSDEYDPHFPVDYEKWKVERKRQREEREHHSEETCPISFLNASFVVSRNHIIVMEPLYLLNPWNPFFSLLNLDDYESREPAQSAISVPSPPKPSVNLNLDLTGEEAYLQRARLSQASGLRHEEDSQGSGEQFAYKMLKQYGWSEGQGLGKHAQGINAPLSVERVAPGFGVIVNAATNQAPETTPAAGIEQTSTVVLLTNMVGPGEVDDSLEEETAEECSKFGQVVKCLIFEVADGQVAKEEAVRIFVQFENVQAAQRAHRELNGRFFAGRKVTARFFDRDRFERLDLAPAQGELRCD